MIRSLALGMMLLAAGLVTQGCATPSHPETSQATAPAVLPSDDVHLIRETYNAVNAMINSARIPLTDHKRIVVATFVDLDDLRTTSQFGRMSSEMVGNRLSQMGYATVSVNLRRDLAIVQDRGEFLLSRDLSQIQTEHAADAVVVGTYVVSGSGNDQRVIVSLRMIDVTDNSLLAGTNYEMTVGPRLRTLLR